MLITLLHTQSAAIAAFEAACPQGVTLAHHLRSDLRYRASAGIDDRLKADTAAHLARLSAGSAAVLVTCDLLSPAVAPPALTADAMLAREVNRRAKGKTVEVFCAWPGSVPHLVNLFHRLPHPSSTMVSCVEGLGDLQGSLDIARHDSLVRAAVEASPAEVIALANPAMQRAAGGDPRVISITEAAIAGALGGTAVL